VEQCGAHGAVVLSRGGQTVAGDEEPLVDAKAAGEGARGVAMVGGFLCAQWHDMKVNVECSKVVVTSGWWHGIASVCRGLERVR
jgi:hypothetical protein